MEKIKILITGIGSGRGGIASVVLNTLRYLDKDIFDATILLTYDSAVEQDIIDLGYNYIKVTPFGENKKKYAKEIDDYLSQYKVDYVWINNTSKVDVEIFKLAKKHGAKTIAHSHGECVEGSFIKRIAYRIIELFTSKTFYKNLDIAISCSESSAKYFYNKRFRKKHTVHILRNSIDTELFKYNEELRKEHREILNVAEDEKLICAVGRLTQVKNPLFLVELLKKLPDNYKMVFIGKGPLEDQIWERARELCVENRLMLLGLRNDVNSLLNAMDIFVLPSFHEGFPVSVIEAQTNGLNCFISDKVTPECVVCDNCQRLELIVDKWSLAIQNVKENNRDNYYQIVKEKGFDNLIYTKNLEKILIDNIDKAK